jgi:hypothetical protein
MTGDLIEDIMKKMPETVTPQQLAAFVMLLVDTYAGGPREGSSLLLTTFVTYNRTCGVPDTRTAMLLKGTAEHLDKEETVKKKMH